MKTLMLALLLNGVAALCANAESFTGTLTSTVTHSNSFASPDGTAVLGANTSIAGEIHWPSGKATTIGGSCINWTTPPGSTFQVTEVCNFNDTGGDVVSALLGCDFSDKAMTTGDCWAALAASAGPHAHRTGTMSLHFRAGSDAGSLTIRSVGQWND